METSPWQTLAYLASSMLFILSLRNLSTQEQARRGNLFGAIGMVIAIAVTVLAVLVHPAGAEIADRGEAIRFHLGGWLAGPLIVGTLVGSLLAARVAMTSMPELVAILHSFVGAAAVLVGIANFTDGSAEPGDSVHKIEIFVGVFVGAITFTGSVIAFFKLRGTLGSKPLLLPMRHALNAVVVLACLVFGVCFLSIEGQPALMMLLGMTILALGLGVHLVMAIGGGDMPVVVSLLNSYSGWAAAAAGFMLGNDLLIITGALVGSSGAILSFIMCRAMNRSIWSVVFGGFGAAPAPGAAAKSGAPVGTVTETNVNELASMLLAAKNVVVVPGYGMAVAQAQHAVKEITSLLTERGVKAIYAIHPVAGRLPGHMNVLLAEAGVSYEVVKEMDEVNPELPSTDLVLVIGANDIVNPDALDDASSPIFGMPVLEVWKAGRVVMLKRGMSAGYAGVDNPLAYRENTRMLFGDAKSTVNSVLTALRAQN